MTFTETVQRAFRDWNESRAYLDNGGNYRVRPEAATPTHRPKGKIASWNKEVKRLFPSCAEFHIAAKTSDRNEERQMRETTTVTAGDIVSDIIDLLRKGSDGVSGDWECSEAAKAVQELVAIRASQPEPDAGEEWRVEAMPTHGWRVVDATGQEIVADVYRKEDAAQIVTDHTRAALVPGLVEALTEMLEIVTDEGHADSYQPQCAAARAALALVKGWE